MSRQDQRVFEGLKVLEFCWLIVGPYTTKFFADHGATVIKVESATRVDYLRSMMPFKDGQPGLNRSMFFGYYNTGKLSLALNLRKAEGRDLLHRLIDRWQPDILVESFAPGSMDRLGLGYDDLRKIKPDIIYYSTTQLGQTGPFARYVGVGNISSGLAGLNEITGWPDRAPIGPKVALPDTINPPLGVTAIIAALEYRRRTGKGQRIDVSQVEGCLLFQATALLDYAVNGRVAGRCGNRDPSMAPHGVFPCAGDDRWIAIAVRNDTDWKALCQMADGEPWAGDARFATLKGRKDSEDDLEASIALWTSRQDAETLTLRLQEAGVPAAPVKDAVDIVRDPQLNHMRFFRQAEHAECGPMPYDAPSFALSRTPGDIRAAPVVGQHNGLILKDIVGLSDDQIAELIVAGVVESP